jgi:hypothetical protein
MIRLLPVGLELTSEPHNCPALRGVFFYATLALSFSTTGVSFSIGGVNAYKYPLEYT